MDETPKQYGWVRYAAIPIISVLLAGIYPLILPILEKQYGIEASKREAVKSEITNVIQSEETLESLSQKIEEHNEYYSQTIATLNQQVQEFNEMKQSWQSSKAITLRLHTDGQITFTALDGKEYDAYWNEEELVWKYIKNGNSYIIFQKED